MLSKRTQVYEKVLRNSKHHKGFGQTPKSTSHMLFELDCLHGTLYCCARYSNIKM